MKRIIAFVFLGLLIYAGGFVLFFGVREIDTAIRVPQTLNGNLRGGNTISDKLDSVVDKLGTESVRSSVLGIEFGEPTVRHYYVVPIGEKPNFMVIAVTAPNDIAALENLRSESKFSFTGIIADMDNSVRTDLVNFLKARPKLIGTENNPYTDEIVALNRVTPYIIEVREIGNPDYTPVIVGTAMLIVGGGLAALLIVKIVRERSGY